MNNICNYFKIKSNAAKKINEIIVRNNKRKLRKTTAMSMAPVGNLLI